MVTRWSRCFLTMIVCCVLGWNSMARAAVMAQVDRFNISEDETVNLSIEVTGDDSGDPQTAPLQKDFEILSNNHSSSFSIINGSTSSKSIWQLILRPRHTGALTIPALTVGSATTRPIMIQVNKVQARTSPSGQPVGDVWISMDVSPKQVMVQQQALITIRIYQAIRLNQAQLSEPKADHAIIERLGDDSTYQKRENNRSWRVTERRYALFPQQSGHIDIDPIQLDGGALTGGASFFQSARSIRVRSNALSLDVSGIPADWGATDWLPARQVRIEESWPQSTAPYKVGEPITRTLTLRADGLSSSQLSEFSHDLPDHLKAYPDKPVLKDDKLRDGVHGMRQEKIAIMPMRPGTYILPEIDVPWWNVNSGQMELAKLPARTFKVTGAVVPAPATPLARPQLQRETNTSEPLVKVVEQAGWWKPVAIVSTLGWLLTLLLMATIASRRKNQRPGEDGGRASGSENLKAARREVIQACKRHDAKACERALVRFADILWADNAGGLTALRTYGDDHLSSQIKLLEQHLYAAAEQSWHGEELLRAFEQADFNATGRKANHKATGLPGLYPD